MHDETAPHLSEAGMSLPIEGPVLPLETPARIGRSLWGPFHRLCLQAEQGGRSHTIRSGPFTAEALPDGGLRLDITLHVPTATGAVRATLHLRRDASGAVVETGLEAPAEGEPAAAAALDAMRASLSTPAGGFLERPRPVASLNGRRSAPATCSPSGAPAGCRCSAACSARRGIWGVRWWSPAAPAPSRWPRPAGPPC
jgi:hypothetical protein